MFRLQKENRPDYDSILKLLQSLRSDLDGDHLPNELLAAVKDKPIVLSFFNAHAANLTFRDRQFLNDLMHSHVLLRDGIGIKVLLKVLNLPVGHNLNGTDMIPRLLTAYTRHAPQSAPIALFGTSSPYLERAAKWVSAKGGQVTILADGYQDAHFYIDRLKSNPPGIVILGMGMPKQERIAQLIAAEITAPILIINGGAILDFWAGRFKRAPLWMRHIGMEWLYRLLNEPQRLARRYIWGNFIFLLRVLNLKLMSVGRANNNRQSR